MEYRDYLAGIRFSKLQPDSTLTSEEVAAWLSNIEENIFLDLEITALPFQDKEMKERMLPILSIPRMSTFAIAALINYGVSRLRPSEAFVNVGTWHGFTFLAGMLGNADRICVGVDNFSQFSGETFLSPGKTFADRFKRFRSSLHSFHEMEYREYFEKRHKGLIGFYVYDGEHGYENQLMGLKTAEPFFSEECIVMVDDTNWEDPRKGTLDFIAQSPNKYEILLDRKTACNAHPTFWNGVMVLRRKS